MIVPELLGWLTDPGAGVEVKSSLHEVRLQVDGSLVGFRYGILPEGHPIGTGYLVDVDCYSETPIEATAENVIERDCWQHVCMDMNRPAMAALNGDVDSGWRTAG